MWTTTIIGGRECRLLQKGTGGPAFLRAYSPHEGDEEKRLEQYLSKQCPEASFLVASFRVNDWNAELSPWKASAAFGGEEFDGKGPELLSYVADKLVPWVRQSGFGEPAVAAENGCPDSEAARCPVDGGLYLMGYSLAGLFSLWSLYESDVFSGAVCCSGSLWLDGWDAFAKEHSVKAPSRVYLSLGVKEEKTRNPLLSRVGDCTREQLALLKQDAKVSACTLEWNPGGHFADAAERLAKGVQWILQQM